MNKSLLPGWHEPAADIKKRRAKKSEPELMIASTREIEERCIKMPPSQEKKDIVYLLVELERLRHVYLSRS